MYQTFPRRNADASGLAYNASLLTAGWTVQQVAASIVGSDEYMAYANSH